MQRLQRDRSFQSWQKWFRFLDHSIQEAFLEGGPGEADEPSVGPKKKGPMLAICDEPLQRRRRCRRPMTVSDEQVPLTKEDSEATMKHPVSKAMPTPIPAQPAPERPAPPPPFGSKASSAAPRAVLTPAAAAALRLRSRDEERRAKALGSGSLRSAVAMEPASSRTEEGSAAASDSQSRDGARPGIWQPGIRMSTAEAIQAQVSGHFKNGGGFQRQAAAATPPAPERPPAPPAPEQQEKEEEMVPWARRCRNKGVSSSGRPLTLRKGGTRPSSTHSSQDLPPDVDLVPCRRRARASEASASRRRRVVRPRPSGVRSPSPSGLPPQRQPQQPLRPPSHSQRFLSPSPPPAPRHSAAAAALAPAIARQGQGQAGLLNRSSSSSSWVGP